MTTAKALERVLLVVVLIPLAITGVTGIRDGVRAFAHGAGLGTLRGLTR